MRMEARLQLEYKKLGLPDDGRPGTRLLERYVNQYGENAHEALRDIKKLLGRLKFFDSRCNIIFLESHNPPSPDQVLEIFPEIEENGEINASKVV